MKLSHTFSKLPPGIVAGVLSVWLVSTGIAATYYVDPDTGSMSNPGTADQPWSTLEAVFTANKTFAAGDVIRLRTGYHGYAQVKGNNTGSVTIQPDTSATPTLSRISVSNAAWWVISGLDVCPQNAPGAPYAPGVTNVSIASSCSHITLQNCLIRSAFSVVGWSVADWTSRLKTSVTSACIVSSGTNTIVAGNTVKNTGFGILINKTATNSLVSRNTVQEIMSDGMRGLSDFTTFEYNTVMNFYNITSNHNDIFQSFSTGTNTVTGATNQTGWGTVKNVTLRGNTFISQTDPNQPFPSIAVQGIGNFDGMFENWVIENNLIELEYTNWGIALFGGINCKIVNNTVVKNLIGGRTDTGKPAIQLVAHKSYDDDNNSATPEVPWPVVPSGNLARNNIAWFLSMAAEYGVKDHNISIQPPVYASYFMNSSALDFSLRATSPAVGAGDITNAPTVDILGRARSAPFDLGAYEYPSAYQQWLEANGLPLDASGDGAPTANPTGDGVPNAIKCALGLTLTSVGYGGRMTTGKVTEADGAEYLSLTYTRPEPQLTGVIYTVKTGADVFTWSVEETVEVSNVVNGALRTITVRDTKAFTGPDPNRFIRLEFTVP